MPIYLVNRTESRNLVETEGRDAYFMLEVFVDGRWQRAETYSFSWCGNSYSNQTLNQNSHLKVFGRLPSGGEGPVRARFRRLYETGEPRITNEGFAFYDPETLKEAHYDEMAIRLADAEDLIALITGEVQYPGGPSRGDRQHVRLQACGIDPERAADLAEQWKALRRW